MISILEAPTLLHWLQSRQGDPPMCSHLHVGKWITRIAQRYCEQQTRGWRM